MEGITKHFPGNVALGGANLTVGRGEVHAVVGQNGAGKSTLMKILNGAYRRDGGTVTFDGRPVDYASPQQAQAGGVSTIFQEINLVPFRSVAENIFMGREPRRLGLIDWRTMNRGAGEALGRLGVDIDVRKPLMTYNVALQQMVAIARAVSFEARLVVMDEPTSSLDDREVVTLFEVIRGLKASGVSVIYISHRTRRAAPGLRSDHGPAGREDRRRAAMAEVGKLEIVALMLGKELGEVRRAGATGFGERGHEAEGETLLEVAHLKQGRMLRDASVSVRPGGDRGAGRACSARAGRRWRGRSSGRSRSTGARSASPAAGRRSAARPRRSGPGSGSAQRTARSRGSSRTSRSGRT
jgi:ribose transport system ATP-binding protein